MSLSRPDRPQRLDALASAYAPITSSPRVWTAIASRLGLGAGTTASGADLPWWGCITFWRRFALTSFALAMAFGVIPGSGMGRVALPAPPDVALANVPALAVTLKVAGGSPTGAPQGPVLYTGTVERFY